IGSGTRQGTMTRGGEWAWRVHATPPMHLSPPMHLAFGRVGPSETRLFALTTADTSRTWGDGGRPTSVAFAGDVVAVGRTDGWIALSSPDEFPRAGERVL